MSRGPVLLLLGMALSCSSDTSRHDERHQVVENSTDKVAAREAGPNEACSYITADEASRVLKQPLRYRRDETSSSSHCILTPVSGDAFHGVSLDYQVTRGSMRVYDFFAAQKQVERVTGLGDEALWLAAGKTRGNLVVVKDGDVLSLTITDLRGTSDLRASARAVAKQVLDRL